MKRIISILTLSIMMVMFCIPAMSSAYNTNEYDSAVMLNEGTWYEFEFNSDILLKVNVSDKNMTSVFEITGSSSNVPFHFITYTNSLHRSSTQNSTTVLPTYAAVPHLSSAETGYVKIDYNSEVNSYHHGQTLKIRLRYVPTSSQGWETAKPIGLKEEHTLKFSSMDSGVWYKLYVPFESFKYTISIDTFASGCFMSSIYSEDNLKSGMDPSFADCIAITPIKYTFDITSGSGTYYLHFVPAPFSNDVLNKKIYFATENDNSVEKVKTSFGATVSRWALEDVERAYDKGLIPEELHHRDLTMKVNREEFAAIALNAYEKGYHKTVSEAANCHFVDISESSYKSEIKKAFNIGVVQGMSDTEYSPDSNVTREQVATMLCRVIERIAYDQSRDIKYPTVYAPFADDAKISDWAKPSVYFMAQEGIIGGYEDGTFRPRNTNDIEIAEGYADATREQALKLVVHLTDGNY